MMWYRFLSSSFLVQLPQLYLKTAASYWSFLTGIVCWPPISIACWSHRYPFTWKSNFYGQICDSQAPNEDFCVSKPRLSLKHYTSLLPHFWCLCKRLDTWGTLHSSRNPLSEQMLQLQFRQHARILRSYWSIGSGLQRRSLRRFDEWSDMVFSQVAADRSRSQFRPYLTW